MMKPNNIERKIIKFHTLDIQAKKSVDMWWTDDDRTQESFIFIYLDKNCSIRMVCALHIFAIYRI